MSRTMFSPFASFHRGVDGTNPVLGGINADGSSTSELSMLPTSPEGGGLSGYSPFMGVPWGNTVNYMSEPPTSSPLELPSSPMSPGVLFNPNPSGAGLGAPGSPCSLFGTSHSPNPYNLGAAGNSAAMRTTSGSLAGGFLNSNASAAADAAAAAAAAAFSTQLPAFYYQAAAAAAGGAGAAAAAAASNLQLQAALSQTLLAHPSATLAAAQQQQQLLQASLSAALAGQANPFLQGYPSAVLSALEPMRSAGGSLSLDGGLQQQASVQAAAALLQQQQQQQQVAAAVLQHQQQHAQLRRNLSTPAAVAAQLGLSSAAAAAQAQLGLQSMQLSGGGGGLPLSSAMGRLHVTHSADLAHLDAAGLLAPQGSMGGLPARPKFKARKNSEPKIGPDGQPRLNARQRRTLRRAKERALKGLLEVSQALLQKAEVQVTVPNISHLTALEELAAVEAEKELAAAGMEGSEGCLSPGGTLSVRGGGAGGRPGGQTRSQQLAAAAAAVEESVCEIARAAVAAVTAQATGKDTSSAAAAAHAAAAQAASAAASAGAVLPPGFVLPEVEEPHSEDLPGCGSDPLDSLSHSAPTSPVGSSLATSDPSSGRSSSSSSSSGSLPASGRCSSSGSALSPMGAAKPPVKPLCVPSSSPLCSPLPSPAGAGASKGGSSQLESIDIAGLIGQLSLKKDEGVVDDKLIRDLQIIQSLIGALRAPSAAAGLDMPPGCTSPSPVSAGGARGSRPVPGAKAVPKRSNSYSPGTAAGLAAMLPQ